ncbi:UNVERIFIED_CONTAM: hypothetical protein HDU68_012714 [Siphonaria sp. JEL0065]|nr:hypothetical protein HDU68_012714 [Siphonaria sp. JEL0065]
MAFAVIGFIVLELSRAVLTEGMYSATNRKPLFNSQLTILLVELVRVGVSYNLVLRSKRSPSLNNIRPIAVQSLLWCFNNCIYFAALEHASVATLSILMQLRLPITGILHHVLVKKQENPLVWIALLIIYAGVVLTQWSNSFSIHDMWTVFHCLILSSLSSIASIVSEKTMKTVSMPFWDQQFRVCVLGTISSAVFLAFSKGVYVNTESLNPISAAFTIGSILAAAGAGLFTGIVVKQLDSVVKLIAQAMAALATTILIYLAFGIFKAILSCFLIGSLLLVIGTVLYGLETSSNPAHEKFRALYRPNDGGNECVLNDKKKDK